MLDLTDRWLQHPENVDMYFRILESREGSDGITYWDAFQVVSNDKEASAKTLQAITREGLINPDKVPLIATQVLTSTVKGVVAKIVLHVPMSVSKEDLIRIKNSQISAEGHSTPFRVNLIN